MLGWNLGRKWLKNNKKHSADNWVFALLCWAQSSRNPAASRVCGLREGGGGIGESWLCALGRDCCTHDAMFSDSKLALQTSRESGATLAGGRICSLCVQSRTSTRSTLKLLNNLAVWFAQLNLCCFDSKNWATKSFKTWTEFKSQPRINLWLHNQPRTAFKSNQQTPPHLLASCSCKRDKSSVG